MQAAFAEGSRQARESFATSNCRTQEQASGARTFSALDLEQLTSLAQAIPDRI
jgi:hypothetical protein